jgi:hypothetical protein
VTKAALEGETMGNQPAFLNEGEQGGIDRASLNFQLQVQKGIIPVNGISRVGRKGSCCSERFHYEPVA